jgi:hypothetical protein
MLISKLSKMGSSVSNDLLHIRTDVSNVGNATILPSKIIINWCVKPSKYGWFMTLLY